MQDTKQKCFVVSANIEKYEFFEEFYLDPDPALPCDVVLDLACHIRLSGYPAIAWVNPLSKLVTIKYHVPVNLPVPPCLEFFVYDLISGVVVGQSWMLQLATPQKPFRKTIRFSKSGEEFRFLGCLGVKVTCAEVELLEKEVASYTVATFGSVFERASYDTVYKPTKRLFVFLS